MSASEVAPNPFWYAKLTAALTSRDRLSICVLAMFVHQSVDQLSMVGVGKRVKPPACPKPRSGITRCVPLLAIALTRTMGRITPWQRHWLLPMDAFVCLG